MARSRRSAGSVPPGASRRRSTSSSDSASGSDLPSLGAEMFSVGSLSIAPSSARNPKNERIDAIFLALVLSPNPFWPRWMT